MFNKEQKSIFFPVFILFLFSILSFPILTIAETTVSEFYNTDLLSFQTTPGTNPVAKDNISGKVLTNPQAVGDIQLALRDAQKAYNAAIRNGKGEDVAKTQADNVLKAGSVRANIKQDNNAGNAGWVRNSEFGSALSSIGIMDTQAEIDAKIYQADAKYKEDLAKIYEVTGSINDKYDTSANLRESAAIDNKTAEILNKNGYSNGAVSLPSNTNLVPGAGGTYTLLAPIGTFFPDGKVDVAGGGLGGYLNGLYRAGIAIATGLALIMIVVGGLEYVSVDSIQGKSNGRERIKNALLGLLLALTSYIILRQINPNLLKSDLQVDSVASIGGIEGSAVSLKGEEMVIVQNIQDASQNALLYGFNPAGGVGGMIGNAVGSAVGGVGGSNGVWWGYENVRKLLSSIPNGKRSTDGSLIFSNYWNGDTNTNQQRGNNCNLLVSGSVALSPDLIRTRKPRLGSAVLVNSLVVGYFDDTTSESAEGTLIRNTIDIYDPKISYGRILKKMPPGSWTLSFGEVRKQAPNPCPPKK